MSLKLIPILICGLLWGQTPSWQPFSHPGPAKAMAVNLEKDGNDLIMSWILPSGKHEGRLQMAKYNGREWQKPVTIVESDQLFINWADIPKVSIGKKLSLAAWPQMMGEGIYEYGLRYKTSTDRGVTWSAPAWLHDDRTPGEHGFVSLAKVNDGTIGAIWLDGRAMVAGQSEHDHHGSGSMQLRYRTISKKGLSAETLLDAITCECCGTDLVLHQKKPVAIYRDRTEKHIRDIRLAFQNSAGQWQKQQALAHDGWEIHGCPVNGPALATNQQQLIAAWFTMANQTPKIRLAMRKENMKDWQDLGSLGKTPLGRVDIAFLDEHHFILSWLESEADQEAVFYTIFRHDKKVTQLLPARRLDGTAKGRSSGFPKIITVGKDCFIAYQAPEKPEIKLQRFTWERPTSKK